MLEVLDAAVLRRWYERGLNALAHARADIDAINVFPVADADTGTNLYLTLRAAADSGADSMKQVVRAVLLGAHGSSGVILSQLVRGFVEGAEADGPANLRGRGLAAALTRAADLGYGAVGDPVEGTMLTVARRAAVAATATGSDDLAVVVRAAATAAREALRETPGQLDVLADAGVVDAGGRGLTALLDVLDELVTGDPAPRLPGAAARRTPRPAHRQQRRRPSGHVPMSHEVMYLLDPGDDDAIPALRLRLGAIGESVVVSGGEGLWNVHVHVDDVGAALEAGVQAGSPRDIRVTRLIGGPSAAGTGGGARAVVAVIDGAGLAGIFERAGAIVVAGDTADDGRPSADAVVAAIAAAGAPEVVLLPNGWARSAVTDAVATHARAGGVDVVVVPSRSCVQGMSALAVHDPARRFADDVTAMSAASGATRWGHVAIAPARALTGVGVCEEGDVLGLLDDEIALIGDDAEQVAGQLAERLLRGGGELVTVVTGVAAEPGSGERLAAQLRAAHPGVETSLYAGGQPESVFVVGVE